MADPSAHGTLTPTHQFDQPGVFLVALQATDSNGVTRLGTAYVSVADVAPDVNPGSDLTVAEGTPVTFQGTATSAGGPAVIASTQQQFPAVAKPCKIPRFKEAPFANVLNKRSSVQKVMGVLCCIPNVNSAKNSTPMP